MSVNSKLIVYVTDFKFTSQIKILALSILENISENEWLVSRRHLNFNDYNFKYNLFSVLFPEINFMAYLSIKL